MSLQPPQRSSQPMEGGSRLLHGKGVIPVFMTFPASADSCLCALCPMLSQNKHFRHQFGLNAVGKGKASLSRVRKFNIARFPLQLHLNKEAACSEQEPIRRFQPKAAGMGDAVSQQGKGGSCWEGEPTGTPTPLWGRLLLLQPPMSIKELCCSSFSN